MGIPHLATHLRPYATTRDLFGERIVIDGPAFAFHIFHLCLGFHPHARNQFEATPSAALLGQVALEWLEKLKSRGIDLTAVIFDGYLPPSKSETRENRLKNYTRQLSTYHSEWPNSLPSAYTGSQLPDMVTLAQVDSQSRSSRHYNLPASHFLVSIILEALLASKEFCNITRVVRGEADAHCANYLKWCGGVALTNDSDLLVHDVGDRFMVFFKDVEQADISRPKSLVCLTYNPVAIFRRLGFTGRRRILSFAFELHKFSWRSTPELLTKSAQEQSISSFPEEFATFSTEYASLPAVWEEGWVGSALTTDLEKLDPRISEYVLQIPSFGRQTRPLSRIESSNTEELDVFLPFLLDCPIRASAWEMSTSVRQLAYGLVNFVLSPEERINSVIEHRRKQSDMNGKALKLPERGEAMVACKRFLTVYNDIFQLFSKPNNWTVDDTTLWRTFCLYQDTQYSNESGRPSTFQILLATAEDSGAIYALTWERIQTQAQLDAAFYSFRILKQILHVVLVTGGDEIPQIFREMEIVLDALPPLSSMLSPLESIRKLAGEEDRKIWNLVREMLKIGTQPSTNKTPNKGKSKKNRRERKQRSNSKAVQKGPANIFEVLSPT